MKKYINSKGLTLVEVLSVLVLLSLIFLLIMSTQIFGQREYVTQSDRVSNEDNLQFIIKDFTREVRRVKDNSLIVMEESNSTVSIAENKYKLINNKLMKNDRILANNVNYFKVEFNNAKDTISVEIKSGGSKRTKEVIKATIFLREGDMK